MKTNTNKSADIIVDISFGLLTLLSVCISPIYDTFHFALPVLGLVLAMYYLAKYTLPNYSLYQYVGSASFALITALLIYQMHGMIEMHFIAFIAAIILIYYKKWQLQLPLTLIVVVHHVVLAYVQFSGYKEVYFTTADYMDLQTFVVHVALAAIIFFLCGFWAYIFKKYELESVSKAGSLETQVQIINRNIIIADEIANGKLDIEIELVEGDLLANSLLIMQKNLLSAKEKEEIEKFTNIGVAQCSELLRQTNVSMTDFTMDVLRFVIKYFDANQGTFFILNDDNKNNSYLELAACYAYNRKKHIEQRVEIGEGLVGTAFLEKEMIFLTDVPQDYIKITSGLGASLPGCIIIVPLVINDNVYGVIEMAFFQPLDTNKIELLKKLSENIAATIKNVKINENTKKLLENSQQQGEELRAQEEEVRQNMEEMQATQEEMHRRQIEITEFQRMTNSIIKSSPGAVYRCHLDSNFTMVYISDKVFQILGYYPKQFTDNSIHLAELIHQEDILYVEKGVNQALVNKTPYELNYRMKHKNNHYVHVWEIGEGVFDEQGKPQFIEGTIIDVTDKKLKEEEVRQNMEELKSIQEELERKSILASEKENELEELMEEMKVNEEDMQQVEKKYRQLTIEHQKLLKTLEISIDN